MRGSLRGINTQNRVAFSEWMGNLTLRGNILDVSKDPSVGRWPTGCFLLSCRECPEWALSASSAGYCGASAFLPASYFPAETLMSAMVEILWGERRGICIHRRERKPTDGALDAKAASAAA